MCVCERNRFTGECVKSEVSRKNRDGNGMGDDDAVVPSCSKKQKQKHSRLWIY